MTMVKQIISSRREYGLAMDELQFYRNLGDAYEDISILDMSYGRHRTQ